MKMGDFIADIVNLFLLGYLFCLWDKRTEGKKLGIIILVWAGILCIPQQIHIINKSLFAQFVFVWILAEGKWFQKAVWFIQMQMIILGLDFLVIDLMVLGKKITNIKVSQLLITNMAVYIRFIIILVFFFLLRNRRKETGNIIKNLSYRMALYIFGTMVITLLTLGITQVYMLGNRSEKLVKAMPVFILLVGILQFVLCILVQKIVYDRKKLERISRMNEYCVEIQEKNYSEINRKNNDLRKFRHDYQEHIYVMQKLVKENHIEELKEYIESLGQKQESVSYIRTGNVIADAVVNQMYEMAAEKDISFEYNGKFPQTVNQTNKMILCSVLYNALKNAVENAEKSNISEKNIYMNVEADFENGWNIIEIINTANEPVVKDGKLLSGKNDILNYGIGIDNIRLAMDECEGKMEWYYDEGKFHLLLYFLSDAEVLDA